MAKKATKSAAAQAAAAPTTSTKNASKKQFISLNRFAISGNICERGLKVYDNGTVRLTVAHNMGRNRDALYTDIVMFPKNGKKDVVIPAELLKKGKNVIVSGYRRANNWVDKDGGKHYRIDFIALEIVENTENKSVNSFEVTGNICEKGLKVYDEGTVRMSIGHNFGRSKLEPLFTDIVMFPKNGKKDVEIPTELVKKGQAVVVSGYRRPNNWVDKDGGKHYQMDYVALSLSENGIEPAEAAEAEPETEAEA